VESNGCDGHVTSAHNYATFCILPLSYKYAAFLIDSAIYRADSKRVASGEKMKLLDICVIGLISIVFLGRFPSPLNSLKCDLVSKNRLTALSAVCDLLALLVVCDYIASRFSPVGQNHPGWIAAEIVCLVALGLLLGPAFRAFLLRFFAKNSSRTQPVKAALVTPIKFG